MLGKVSRDLQAYGFIQPEGGGPQVFYHWSAITSEPGYKRLYDGDQVEFEIVTAEDGRTRADDIKVLERAPREEEPEQIREGAGY